jgi:hypothetical protein
MEDPCYVTIFEAEEIEDLKDVERAIRFKNKHEKISQSF